MATPRYAEILQLLKSSFARAKQKAVIRECIEDLRNIRDAGRVMTLWELWKARVVSQLTCLLTAGAPHHPGSTLLRQYHRAYSGEG